MPLPRCDGPRAGHHRPLRAELRTSWTAPRSPRSTPVADVLGDPVESGPLKPTLVGAFTPR